jgi:hypothetical protein
VRLEPLAHARGQLRRLGLELRPARHGRDAM